MDWVKPIPNRADRIRYPRVGCKLPSLVLTPSGVTFVCPCLLYYLVVLRQIGIRAELDQKKKKILANRRSSHTKTPTHTMTKITFIYLPHEICAAAAKTTPPPIINKLQPLGHWLSRLFFF